MVERLANLSEGGALMEVYAESDLHSTNAYVAMVDENNNVLYKHRHQNEVAYIFPALDPFKRDIQGALVERTYTGTGSFINHLSYQ